VDPRSEIREFLTSRRAKITPEQAGLISYGSRRVPGLRREEVAVLAGVSVPYYTRIERGDMSGVSDSVLEALARALQLDDAERAHLFDLARALRPVSSPRRRRAPRQRVRPSIQHVLEGLTGAAAFVHNARLDNLAVNELGNALYSDMFSRAAGPGPVNSARYVFLEPSAREFYFDWDRAASDVVAVLRSAAGRDPYDRGLSDLVGELSTRAPSSALAGPPTTSASTTRAPRSSTTPLSATSPSRTTAWSSPPTPGRRSRSGPRNPDPSPRRRSASSEAGPRHLRSQSYTTPQTIPKQPA
jgi:transcriptional regulator with XRE-family HTH domain